ncbi:heavy-metal-associated domain-containing protein [Polymorphobacter sp.]|uniref:heavy-metal-associated domain-containing protein n=1 Tax=Polymorphobacter sp. TaxID=1909290 RepID=UPI003F71A7CA
MSRALTPLVLVLLLALSAQPAVAQAPPRVQAPEAAASAGSAYSIGGIAVDVSASTPQAARLAGFRLAQRKAWPLLWSRLTGNPATAAPRLSDGQLDGIVSGIESQGERFSMTRYIARLAVVFDRSRVVDYFGGVTSTLQSPPMLLLPVWIDGGASVLFQQKTPWAAAWARFRENVTPLDYVVPPGSAADNVLLTGFQLRRPERSTWRTLLTRYDAVDVLIAEARLVRRWPGGPLRGEFLARHGPDAQLLGRFTLTADDDSALPAMLDEATRRIDEIYAEALRSGQLQAEAGLAVDLEPVIAAPPFFESSVAAGTVVDDQIVSGLEIVVGTPDSASYGAIESALRRVPGVMSVAVTSLSLGGNSRLLVSYVGGEPALRASLAASGLALGNETPLPVLRRGPVVALPPAAGGTPAPPAAPGSSPPGSSPPAASTLPSAPASPAPASPAPPPAGAPANLLPPPRS